MHAVYHSVHQRIKAGARGGCAAMGHVEFVAKHASGHRERALDARHHIVDGVVHWLKRAGGSPTLGAVP